MKRAAKAARAVAERQRLDASISYGEEARLSDALADAFERFADELDKDDE